MFASAGDVEAAAQKFKELLRVYDELTAILK